MRILGIETSCDETAAALLEIQKGKPRLIKNTVFSQIEIHKEFGGVVPEVAARNHIMTILPVLKKTLEKKKPDIIAVTAGPGLITSLLVGVQTARALSYLWKKPLIPINHIEGHLYAAWLEGHAYSFPALGLIVSGGHTELILMKKRGSYLCIGKTLDDAAGEAFDKVAKILHLGYPGGPIIDIMAQQGDRERFAFPRPMIDHPNLNFSFSGLKTAVLYCVRDREKNHELSKKTVADICASFQQAVIDVLVSKTLKAIKKHTIQTLLVGGGVVANQELRQQLKKRCEKEFPNLSCFLPSPRYCTDNAAMIAAAAYFHPKKNTKDGWKTIWVDSGWELGK